MRTSHRPAHREAFTFRYRNVHWQVEATDAKELRPKQKVIIERRLDGSAHYRCGERYLTPVRLIDDGDAAGLITTWPPR